MKTRHILTALCAAAAAGLTSCFGFDAALDGGNYYNGSYDGLWYNGFGYGNNYYGGYWGPNYGWGPDYGWGPGVPPPLIGGGPGPVRPPQQAQPRPPFSPGGSGVANGPAFPTRPDGTQRPGNNGRPTQGINQNTPSAGEPVTLPDNIPVGRALSPSQTTTNRGRH